MRLPREVGWGNDMRYLLIGDEFNAEEALRIGLVPEVLEPGQQFTRATELAQAISAQATIGVRSRLKSVRLAMIEAKEAAKRQFQPDLEEIMQSGNIEKDIQSFIKRRQVNFIKE